MEKIQRYQKCRERNKQLKITRWRGGLDPVCRESHSEEARGKNGDSLKHRRKRKNAKPGGESLGGGRLVKESSRTRKGGGEIIEK